MSKSIVQIINKKGFTLTETLISIMIIVIISVGAFSVVLGMNNSAIKNRYTTYGLNEIKNIINIISTNNFVEENKISFTNFEEDLQFLYSGSDLSVIETSHNYWNLNLNYDSNFNFIAGAKDFTIKTDIEYSFDILSFDIKLLKEDKEIYRLDHPFQKVVNL